MHKPCAVVQLERRLADLGCPARLRQRRIREVADHYEDLKQAALEDGLSEADAEARANELLGEPVALAEQLAVVLRQSSWWGRHRIIGFCLLPPVGIFAASVASLFLVLGSLRVFFSAGEWAVLADQGPGFGLLVKGVQVANYAATAATTLLFCWLAQRSISGPRWAILACGVASLQSFFSYCRIAPHAVSIGYSLSPDWICALIPLLIAAAIWARQAEPSKSFRGAVDPPSGFPRRALAGSEGPFASARTTQDWRRALGYPTYWIIAIAALALAFLAWSIWMEARRGWTHNEVPARPQPGVQRIADQRFAGSESGHTQGNADPRSANASADGTWKRVVLIGASATAGFTESEIFGGPNTAQYRLSRYVEAALIPPHEPVRSLASTLFFMQPETEAQREIELAIDAKPSLVIGVDFLFWFCYGEGRTDQDRLRRFDNGLKLCEQISCPLLLGDIPDASGAVNRMLSADEIPSPPAIAAANRRLKQWATVHRNIVVLPLAHFMHAVVANEALTIHNHTLAAGKTGILLQSDRLHPSAPGCAVLALMTLDALQSTRPPATAAEIRWDAKEVFRRGYGGPQVEKPPNQDSATGTKSK